MIREAYVSFEVAKLLKEKGFNTPCMGRYSVRSREFHLDCTKMCNNGGLFDCAAPSQAMAMKWLRTEKYVIIFILPALDDLGNFAYAYDIAEWNESEGIYEMNHMSSWFYTYEEAVEAALKYSLENLI